MLRLSRHQAGISHIAAILLILVVGVVGIVTLRISHATQLSGTNTTTVCHSNGRTIVASKGQTCSITSDSTGVHCKINGAEVPCLGVAPPAPVTGNSGVCSSNGYTITAPAGQSCSITSDSTGVHCKVNGNVVPCTGTPTTTTGGTGAPSTGGTGTGTSTGTGGSSTCSSNGHTVVASAGHTCSITSDSTGVHCKIDGTVVPCTT